MEKKNLSSLLSLSNNSKFNLQKSIKQLIKTSIQSFCSNNIKINPNESSNSANANINSSSPSLNNTQSEEDSIIDYAEAIELLKTQRSKVFPKKISHFINNEFYSDYNEKTAYEEIKILNPSTEETLGSFSEATKSELDFAVESAERAYREWNSMPFDIRVRLFMKLADKLQQSILEFSILESLDNGKVLRDSCEDMKEVIRVLRYYGGFIDKQYGSTISAIDDLTIQTRRVPFGVVGCITPWNYPLLMATWKIIPALCAGNSVILKPSEETPLTVLKFCELFKEVGFPKGFLNVLLGRGPKSEAYLLTILEFQKFALRVPLRPEDKLC